MIQPELKAVVLLVTSEPVPFQPWLNQGRQGAAGQGVHRVHLSLCAAHSDGMEFMYFADFWPLGSDFSELPATTAGFLSHTIHPGLLHFLFFFLLCCICQGEICSLWKREVIFSWLTFLYNYLALMCPRPCRISILLLLIALPHPEHVHLQELPSICEQGQPQSQQEDSIIHVLKCLQAPKLRFSQAISDVVCLGFDASFNTF